MPPLTPSRMRGLRFMGSQGGSRSAGGFFLFGFGVRFGFAEHLVGVLGRRLQDAALGAVSPLDLVVLEFGGGEAGRLQGTITLDLGARAPHELFRAARDEQHEPELAIDPVWHGLDHSCGSSLTKWLPEVFSKALEDAFLPRRRQSGRSNHGF